LGASRELAFVVMPDVFMVVHRLAIISAATRNNVPAVYAFSDFVRDGGLLSYGVDGVDIWRRAASYVDRILRGEKPGDLPVQFPTKFEMAVNLKTAKALGLAVPLSILVGDRVKGVFLLRHFLFFGCPEIAALQKTLDL
jgi:putative ABC transport system substrate-binding protein